MTEVESLQFELKNIQELLFEYAMELNRKQAIINRLTKAPLSDERLYSLYRHSMDWRKFARDVEREHGIVEPELEEDSYYD